MRTAFTLGGKPFNPLAARSCIERAKRYLDKLPVGTLIWTIELAGAVSCTTAALQNGRMPKAYSTLSGNKLIWGSRKTIAALEKSLADND